MKLVTIGSLGLSLTLLGLLSTAACSDSSSSNAPAANDAAVPDTSPANDDAGSNEACVSGPPPAGIRQMANGPKNGKHSALVMDDTGSPVIAYQTDDGGGTALSTKVIMQRWQRACSSWTEPMVVDTFGSQTDNGRQITLAFDKSSGTVGIAYQAIVGTFGVDEHYEIRYAELAKGAAAPTAPQRVEDPKDNDHHPSTPGLGMFNGRVFIAYQEPFRLCGESGCAAIITRTREGGTWGAESVLPDNGKDVGKNGDASDASVAVAVDENGSPGVAWINVLGGGGSGGVDQKVTFARFNSSAAAVVFDNTDDTGTDAPWVDLVFDGTKPRAVVIMNRDANYSVDHKTAWFVESDDGVTWKTAVALPHDANASLDNYASIAIGPEKEIFLAFDSNESDGTDQFGSPKILRSKDLTTFTVGGPQISTYAGEAKWVQLKLDDKGTIYVVMHASSEEAQVKNGMLFYREK